MKTLGAGQRAVFHTLCLVASLLGISAPAGAQGTIAGGYDFTLQIRNGALSVFGGNDYGQLGDGTTQNKTSPEWAALPQGVSPIAVAAGQYHSLAAGSDGNVYAWGLNSSGQLGDGTTNNELYPEAISLGSGFTPTVVAAGDDFTLAIGVSGSTTQLFSWGANNWCQLGVGATFNSPTPRGVTLALGTGVTPKAIAAGGAFALAVGSDNNLYAWGLQEYGELGDGTATYTAQQYPELITIPTVPHPQMVAVAAGENHGLALDSTGNVWGWGLNENGQVGNGASGEQPNPVLVSLPSGVKGTAIAAGGNHSMAIGSDGNLYAWGDTDWRRLIAYPCRLLTFRKYYRKLRTI